MKTRFNAVAALLVLTAFLTGCGVTLSADQVKLVGQTSTLAAETDTRWDTLTPAQQKQAFHGNAELWKQFNAAVNGKTAE